MHKKGKHVFHFSDSDNTFQTRYKYNMFPWTRRGMATTECEKERCRIRYLNTVYSIYI